MDLVIFLLVFIFVCFLLGRRRRQAFCARVHTQYITSNVLHTNVAVSTVVYLVVFRADLYELVLKYDQTDVSTEEGIQPTVKF